MALDTLLDVGIQEPFLATDLGIVRGQFRRCFWRLRFAKSLVRKSGEKVIHDEDGRRESSIQIFRPGQVKV